MTEQAGSSGSESNVHKRKRAAYSCTECTKGKAKVGQYMAMLNNSAIDSSRVDDACPDGYHTYVII